MSVSSQETSSSKNLKYYQNFDNYMNIKKEKGRIDYVNAINQQLQEKEVTHIMRICRLIETDSLFECIPNLKNYISNCKRYSSTHTEDALQTLTYFKDKTNINFIIEDFEKSLNFKINLRNKNDDQWLKTYINVLTSMGIENQHDLIAKAYFDWHGLDLNIINNPNILTIKSDLEKKYSLPKNLIDQNYILKNVIAFIKNAKDITNNNESNIDYIVKIILPYDSGFDENRPCCEIEKKSLDEIVKYTGLSKDNIVLNYNDGVGYDFDGGRFSNFSLTCEFIDYLKKYPKKEYQQFFLTLYRLNYFSGYDLYYVEKYLKENKL